MLGDFGDRFGNRCLVFVGRTSDVDAVSEFASAVQEMGLSPGELGRALVDMASGNDNSPHQAEVQHRWRHLLALRGFDGDRNGDAKDRPVRVRYGPENRSTIC